jgi:hypothetical protein
MGRRIPQLPLLPDCLKLRVIHDNNLKETVGASVKPFPRPTIFAFQTPYLTSNHIGQIGPGDSA